MLKKRYDKDGYYIVTVSKKNKLSTLKIHRLIAISFIDNPENKPCIDHINNDKEDNNINNLRWVTFLENSQNRKISSKNKTGVKGVYFDKKKQKMDCTNIYR